MKSVHGFTLMEVLVALVLLTLFTLTSYRALDAVLNAQRHATAELKRWHERAAAFNAMDSDLANAVARFDPRDPQRSGFHALLGQDGNAQFDLVRLLPEDSDQGVERIGYRCGKDGLARLVWPDTEDIATEPRAANLLAGLTSCALQYLDEHGQWLPLWQSRGNSALPRAVELRIGTADGIPIRRVLHVQ